MSEASKNDRLVHRTGLLYLPNVGASLREVLAASGLGEECWVGACAGCISVQCTICEEVIEGEEWAAWLLALGSGEMDSNESAAGDSMRFMRLRSGCCANTRCNAHFYELTFEPHPAVDWKSVSIGPGEEKEDVKRSSTVWLAGKALASILANQITKRSVAVFALFLALWMFRQWYTGGEIPIIRPAKDYSGEYVPIYDLDEEKAEAK